MSFEPGRIIEYEEMKLRINLYKIFLTIAAFCTFYCSAGNLHAQQIWEVDEIEFSFKGKQTFEDSELKDATAISKSKVYDKDIVIADIQKLKKFYFDNGFFDVEIDTSISINLEDEEASVTFKITENKRYKIDSLVINGVENTSADALAKIRKIRTVKKGDNYTKVLIIQHANEVLDTLQNNGYMNARLHIDSGTVVRRYKDQSRVNIDISLEGADTLYYFGSTKIDIKNNVYGLKTEIPRDEIVYEEGELYSKAKKLDSERNIARISIISGAKINPDSSSTYTGGKVDHTVTITLAKKNELTPFIKGANFENRFYLGAGIKYLNRYFLSGNRTLTLELEEDYNSTSINRTTFSAAVTQPHFILPRITLTDRLSVGFNNVENYKNYFVANLTTLNYFIAPHTFYNNAYLDLTEELIWIKYDTIATGRQTQFNSFLSITFEHDNTNNLLSPSSGFYHSILAGNAGLIPRVVTGIFGKSVFYSQFFKVYTLNKFYFSIAKRDISVIATKISIGDIIEYGQGENIVPVQPIYKFFSGGSSSLRGWNAKENGILDNKIDGGNFLLEGSLELRQKLFPRSEGFLKNIGGAFFIDYGNVWETHKDFKFSEIAYAIGFGLRYDLFIGPIRFDFGFKLYDPAAPEGEKWLFQNTSKLFSDKFRIQFGIGQAF